MKLNEKSYRTIINANFELLSNQIFSLEEIGEITGKIHKLLTYVSDDEFVVESVVKLEDIMLNYANSHYFNNEDCHNEDESEPLSIELSTYDLQGLADDSISRIVELSEDNAIANRKELLSEINNVKEIAYLLQDDEMLEQLKSVLSDYCIGNIISQLFFVVPRLVELEV